MQTQVFCKYLCEMEIFKTVFASSYVAQVQFLKKCLKSRDTVSLRCLWGKFLNIGISLGFPKMQTLLQFTAYLLLLCLLKLRRSHLSTILFCKVLAKNVRTELMFAEQQNSILYKETLVFARSSHSVSMFYWNIL